LALDVGIEQRSIELLSPEELQIISLQLLKHYYPLLTLEDEVFLYGFRNTHIFNLNRGD